MAISVIVAGSDAVFIMRRRAVVSACRGQASTWLMRHHLEAGARRLRVIQRGAAGARPGRHVLVDALRIKLRGLSMAGRQRERLLHKRIVGMEACVPQRIECRRHAGNPHDRSPMFAPEVEHQCTAGRMVVSLSGIVPIHVKYVRQVGEVRISPTSSTGFACRVTAAVAHPIQ
jgi:hypothetical protein